MVRKIFGSLFVCLFSVMLHSLASADPPARFSFKGLSADTQCYAVLSEDGCLFHEAYITGFDQSLRDGKNRTTSQVVSVFVATSNYCTWEFNYAYGDRDLLPGELSIDKKLRSGSLIAPHVKICDPWSGFCGKVDVNISWDALGGPYEFKGQFSSKTPWYEDRQKFDSTWQPALATGTLTDEVGNDLLADSVCYGSMSDSKSNYKSRTFLNPEPPK
ncbi:MAG: hypothetical protein G01um101470_917 [Parcubacteria group bacterium Gr01-1014_70]|nr:MAG: hypothetical protein G01um101470_917 [Parcubacteria group bacterium Gr01-1014_70]